MSSWNTELINIKKLIFFDFGRKREGDGGVDILKVVEK